MQHTARRTRTFARIAWAAALWISAAAPAFAADDHHEATAPSVTTPGLTAKEFAKIRGVLFAQALADVPGKNLVVIALDFPPKPQQQSKTAPQCPGHRHPGSTYVYVTKGVLRLGIAGQPVQVVHAGESFFEPPNALHTVSENASATEPASAIAVHIIPDGGALLTPETKCGKS